MSDDVTFLSQLVRDSMELQAQEALSKTDDREEVMKPLQVLMCDHNNLQRHMHCGCLSQPLGIHSNFAYRIG